MKRFVSLAIAILILIPAAANAAFMDTNLPEKPFNIGARLGMNWANNSISSKLANTTWDTSSWGTGFEMGVIADLVMRDWIAIQPGLFYQSRSHTYSLVCDNANDIYLMHNLSYTLQIPVLCSARFNVTENIRWIAECGPYMSVFMGHQDSGMTISIDPEMGEAPADLTSRRNSVLVGVKVGTGILVRDHYWIGVHYQGGFNNLYKSKAPIGSHAKTWSLTVGYNF